MPFIGDFRMWEWIAVPTVFVRAPWAFALSVRRLHREACCRFWRVALRTLRRSWLEVSVNTCMQRLAVSGMVHHGWRSVSERGRVESGIGGVIGLLVYKTQ